MRYEELKKSLITKIENGYILYGSDFFLLNNSIKVILESTKLDFPEFNFIKFDEENLNLDDVVRSLETLPIMSEKKVVLLDLSNNPPKLKFDALKAYFLNPNPSCVFILNLANNFDSKNLPLDITAVDCNPISKNIAIKFIQNEFRKYGKQVSVDNIELILDYCKNDLNNSIKEVNKLSNYVGDKEITTEDINLICTDFKEYQIFELTEQLANKNSSKVFEILYLFKKSKEQGRGLFGLIYSHFRRLFFVSINSTDIKELSKLLEIKEFAVQKCIKQAKMFNKKQLKMIVDKCSELDFEIKQSLTNFDTALDILVLFILNL